MGKKGRNSSSSPSPSSLTKAPKYSTIQKSSRSIEGLTPWERKMAETSKASRSNVKGNEEAINYAAGVLEPPQATSSNATPTEKVVNDLAIVKEAARTISIHSGLIEKSNTIPERNTNLGAVLHQSPNETLSGSTNYRTTMDGSYNLPNLGSISLSDEDSLRIGRIVPFGLNHFKILRSCLNEHYWPLLRW